MRFVVTYFDKEKQINRARLCRTLDDAKNEAQSMLKKPHLYSNLKIKVIKRR